MIADFVARVRSVTGGPVASIQPPPIAKADADLVREVVINDPVGYTAIEALEMEVSAFCRRRFAIAVSSGTAAIHLALLAVGVSPGDDVIMPTLTFAGAAAAVRYCRATPFLVDCEERNLSPDRDEIEDAIKRRKHTRNFAAIMSVDLLGHPAANDLINSTALTHGIPMIADAAESLGSMDRGKPCGSFGTISILSFNNNKIVSTGGGGMVLTDDPAIAAEVRHLATTARKEGLFFDHADVGFNYRMPNVCAALGLGQFRRLVETIKLKRELAARYLRVFQGSGFLPAWERDGCSSNFWLNAVAMPATRDVILWRDRALAALQMEKIATRALFTPLHLQAPYADCPRVSDLKRSVRYFDRMVILPSGSNLVRA